MKQHVLRHVCRVTVPCFKTVHTPSGPRRERLPDTTEEVELTIDLARLAQMLGGRAVQNSGGRARALNGLIAARHLRFKG